MATSEATPLAKAGGLADACGALPVELAELGHRAALIMPAYRQVFHCGAKIEPMAMRLEIPVGNKTVTAALLETKLPGSQVPVYLVQQDDFFNRPGIYGDQRGNYRDNCQRFVFFCRAVMETVRLLDLPVDILHVNDWPTSLIPAYLDIEYRGTAGFENVASLLTIHNVAFQGRFWHWDMLLTGLDWKYFNWHQMEFYGDLNLLKTGIVFADAVNTVSPRYAREIQTPPSGYGLEEVLQHRRDGLVGITSGIDEAVWNPATDSLLATNYDPTGWKTGKAACKTALQVVLGLPPMKHQPLIGVIGPLVEENGVDLITQILESWAEEHDAQWAVLGSSSSTRSDLLRKMARIYPRKVAVRLGPDDELQHGLIAGADILLIPSRVQPCGFHQLCSLKYGTVPVVHAVGGLADTVIPPTPEHLKAGVANGFHFDQYTAAALDTALRRACDTYGNQPDIWSQLVAAGMRQDVSWRTSASKYVRLYQQTLARLKQTVCA